MESNSGALKATEAIGVRIALQLESMARFSQSVGQTEVSATYHKQSQQSLRSAEIEAEPLSTKSIELAAYNAGILTALNKAIPSKVLDKLKSGQSKDAKALADIYGSKTLTPAKARELAKEVHDLPEIGAVAAYQALEKGGDKEALLRFFPKESFLIFGGLAMVFGAGLLGGLLAWVLFFANFNKASWRPLGHPLSPTTRSQASFLGLLSVGLIGLFLVNGTLFESFGLPSHVATFFGSFCFILILLALTNLVVVGDKNLYSSLNQSPHSLWKQVGLGIAGWAANLPILGVLMGVLNPWIQSSNADHPMNEMLSKGGGPAAAFALFFAGAVVAPIWEEIAFRGALFGGLRNALGRTRYALPMAILLSSLAFASIHPQGPALWLILGWIGAMGCLLTYWTRSIIPAMVMHAVHNGLLLLMSITLLG